MFATSANRESAKMKSLVEEARNLLNEANAASGQQADELRKKGSQLLETGIAKAKNIQEEAINTGKEIANSTDTFVHENPWRSIAVTGAIAAGIGVLIGLASSRKQS
jgi:ElaB/YqjD/DUF883 family membrane-anchored ribosome-binding protein